MAASCSVLRTWRILRWSGLRVNLQALRWCPPFSWKLGRIQVTSPNSSLCGQNNITVVLFHLTGTAAKEVSRMRCCGDRQTRATFVAPDSGACVQDKLSVYGRLGGICGYEWIMRVSGEGEKKPHMPFSPPRNCRFQCRSCYNPQSQQMISLACIADSPTHIHGRAGQYKGKRKA